METPSKLYDELVRLHSQNLVSNPETFECPVCHRQCELAAEVTLQDCLHSICRQCLKNTVIQCERAVVKCPYSDEYSCTGVIMEKEIKQLLDEAAFNTYLSRCYTELLKLHGENLVSNVEVVKCPVCLNQCEPAEGVTLQACLHSFCKRCLEDAVQSNETGVVKCLYKDEDYSCNSIISEKEIKSLVSDEIYKLYMARSNDRLQKLHTQSLVLNMESFQCSICFQQCEPDSGAQLQECLHEFCKPCIESVVKHSDEISVKCPYIDVEYSCQSTILEKEIKALVDEATFEKYLARSLDMGEVTSNSFHCKTPDCRGWCIIEDAVNYFTCPICEKRNCIRCQTIHTEGFCPKNEKETLRSEQEAQSLTKLDGMVMSREGTPCPKCKVIITKAGGCPHMLCTLCKTNFNWPY